MRPVKFCPCIGNRILIVDYRYYVRHQEEIEDWVDTTFGYMERSGMVLDFKNETDLCVFLLKWG